MDFPGENTGVGYHFLFPEDLPDPGIKPESPALQVDALPSTPPGKTSLCCYCQVTSVSDSVRPHPWDSPGKNTGVGCHVLLQCMKVKSKSEVAQPCPTLVTPWIIAHQAPPSMGFSRQEYWSGCHRLLWDLFLPIFEKFPLGCALILHMPNTSSFLSIFLMFIPFIFPS